MSDQQLRDEVRQWLSENWRPEIAKALANEGYGWEASDERKAWLPLVVVSAEEDARTIKAAMDAGALGFIPQVHSSSGMLSALGPIPAGAWYVP